MSLRALKLTGFNLLSSADDLNLSIISIADLRLQTHRLVSLVDDDLVRALISGSIWVSRGIYYRFDIQISFNGNVLYGKIRNSVLESLGSCIRDGHLWSQLSLSASLQICQLEDSEQPQPDMSIYINHDTTSSSSKSQSRVSLLNTADAKAPGSVLCAEFERLQIYLNFYTPALPPRPPRKQAKTCSQEPESPDTMLLDDDPELEKEDHFEDFEDVVGRLSQELSKSIARCFDHFLVPERRDPIPLNSASHIFGPKESASTIFDVTSNNESRSKGGRFPMATTDTLKTWFETHLQHPYPTKEEKRRLMEETGVTDKQLGKWFEKARQHKKKSTADKPEDEDMLLFEPEENISVRRNVEDIDEDEISQPATYPPSFTSQLSVASTSSTVSSSHPPKCSLHANTDESQHSHPTLSISAANKLSFFAIRFLITGCKTQPKRDMQGITIEKPLPDPGKSLSRIAPSLFSPGFKEIMGINANFLQTISHAISTSWVRNVQSPSLRKKLEALANLTTSQYPDRNQESAEEQGSSQRLAAVVQAKLWGVMQRKLYDPTAVRKLRHQTLPERVGGVVDEEDCEDLLGDGVAEENGIDFEDMSCRDFMDEEVVEEFDDLLAGQDADHDEDLLHYFEGQAAAERERLEVKIKTDEMLFGSECDSESEDGILLLDSETERMLL